MRGRSGAEHDVARRLRALVREIEAALDAGRPSHASPAGDGALVGRLTELVHALLAGRAGTAAASIAPAGPAEIGKAVAPGDDARDRGGGAGRSVSGHEHAVLKYIIASVPHSIFWKDREGRFLGGNDNLLRDLGVRSLEEVIGRTDYDFFPREQADFFRRCDGDVMESGKPLLDIEEPQDQPDGTHTLLTSKVPLRDEHGTVVGLLGIYADITERKRMEEDLRKARDAAEAAARAKSDFVAVMSHELRTPLTLMAGPLDWLLSRREELPVGVREVLERMRRNAGRLLSLVNDVLEFSRLEAGRTEIDWEPTDAVELVAAIVSDAIPAAEAARLRLTFEADGDLRDVWLDRRKFEKITLNLVGNALKFTPAGGRVDVRLKADGDHFELSVMDNGPGIPREKQGLLFQRFQQIESSIARRHEGTGIGLALVKELSELMSGTVSVESEPGAGSRFCVRLPRAAGHGSVRPRDTAGAAARRATLEAIAARVPEPVRPSAPLAAAQPPGSSPPGQPRVLVVDDNADMRAYLREVLGERFAVEAVEGGRRALEAARTCPPEVVISDVMMPEMDGLELVARLKADAALRHVPVILLTARAGAEEVVTGLDVGADDYLAKPFSPAELNARVEAARRLHQAYVDLAAQHAQLAAAHEQLKETQQQLVHAAKIAAVGTLVAGLSHELNNPLGIILMHAQGLLGMRRPDDAALQRGLAVIERHTKRCAKLIETLLDFSRRKTTARERVSPRQLLGHVADLAGIKARRADVELKLETDADGVPDIVVCVQEMESALLNLVSNAFDATPAQGSVRLAARKVERSGQAFVELEVRDTGHGIPPEVAPRIFDPFFTTKPVGQGTGLGLALARQIIEDHGGEITVESAPQAGTTVLVRLPAASGSPGSGNRPEGSMAAG